MDFSLRANSPIVSLNQVSFNNYTLTGFSYSLLGNNQIYKLNLNPSLFLINNIIPLNFLNPSVLNIKKSQVASSPNGSYLIYWDDYTNIYIYNSTNNTASPVYLGSLLSNLSIANLT